MFYNADILARRKEGLGLVWLAATLGDRSVVKKLTRRDILSVNVPRVCRNVVEPSEPMALRLSSQLMFGIVRIYVHQNELWMTDVTNVHASLRKSMLAQPSPLRAATGPGAVPSLNMRIPLANKDAITLPTDTAFYALDFETTFLIDLPDAFALRERAATPIGIGDGFRGASPIPPSPRHVVPERRITLPHPPYDEEEPGIPRRRPTAAAEEMEWDFLAPPRPQEEELDLGLDLGAVEPQAFPEEAMPPLVEPSSEAVEMLPPPPPPAEAGAPEERIEPLALAPPEEAVPAPAPAVAVAERPRRRKVRVLEDRILELSDDELRASRRDYEERMSAQRRATRRIDEQRSADRMAHALVFDPPSFLASAPGLVDVWNATAGANLAAIGERFQNARRRVAAGLPVTIVPAREADEEMPPSPGVGLDLEAPAPSPPPTDLTDLEAEVARGLSPTTLAARRRAGVEVPPWELLAEERRRARREGSLIAPSEASILAGPAAAAAAPPSFGIETPTGLVGRRARRTPTPVRLAAGRPSISFPSPSLEGFDLGPAPPPSSPLLRLPSTPIRPLPAPAEEGIPALPHPSSVMAEDLDEETANFFAYARAVQEQLADAFLFFSDLAPVASTSPSVAAQAFYHVLALTQSRRMRVKQDAAYGEIEIALSS